MNSSLPSRSWRSHSCPASGLQADHRRRKREGWETLLLSGHDEVEVALIERQSGFRRLPRQDEVADFVEDTGDCQPEAASNGGRIPAEVRPSMTFSTCRAPIRRKAATRSMRCARTVGTRDAILQADGEGFTNEEGFHILWQFSDSVSGPWNMGVLQDGTWHHFKMDLGDPDHRAAFMAGEVPADLTAVQVAGPHE